MNEHRYTPVEISYQKKRARAIYKHCQMFYGATIHGSPHIRPPAICVSIKLPADVQQNKKTAPRPPVTPADRKLL